MKIQFALSKIMKMFSISQSSLAKNSGVGADLINKLVKGERRNPTFDTVQRLADGLAKIDPLARPLLYEALQMHESNFSSEDPSFIAYTEPYETSEAITAIVEMFLEDGLIDVETYKRRKAEIESGHIRAHFGGYYSHLLIIRRLKPSMFRSEQSY